MQNDTDCCKGNLHPDLGLLALIAISFMTEGEDEGTVASLHQFAEKYNLEQFIPAIEEAAISNVLSAILSIQEKIEAYNDLEYEEGEQY